MDSLRSGNIPSKKEDQAPRPNRSIDDSQTTSRHWIACDDCGLRYQYHLCEDY